VIAVEIDGRLLPALHEVVAGAPGVMVVQGDILELDLDALVGDDPYCVVANIPYNITSLLIRRLLESPNCPQHLTLTIQLEVAERIVAEPGQMSLLALSVLLYGIPRIKARIPSSAFFPQPNVDSAVLRVDLHPEAILPAASIPVLFQLARAGFQQKRKQLRNSLSSGLNLPSAKVVDLLEASGIRPQARPQELSLADWARLVEVYAQRAS
jgi:16S rRNA (adenine1518-N6/adenine1519-N6)-dimethyltransferase